MPRTGPSKFGSEVVYKQSSEPLALNVGLSSADYGCPLPVLSIPNQSTKCGWL